MIKCAFNTTRSQSLYALTVFYRADDFFTKGSPWNVLRGERVFEIFIKIGNFEVKARVSSSYHHRILIIIKVQSFAESIKWKWVVQFLILISGSKSQYEELLRLRMWEKSRKASIGIFISPLSRIVMLLLPEIITLHWHIAWKITWSPDGSEHNSTTLKKIPKWVKKS